MTALSNANTSWDGIKSHSIGLASFVLPKANSSDTGVSVRYALVASLLRSQEYIICLQRKVAKYIIELLTNY